MLTQLTAASTEPVTLAEAKAHLRLAHSADDTLLTRQIKAAREHVELLTGRSLAAATYRYTTDNFTTPLDLPLWPVSSVTEVSYLDANDTRVILGAYTFDADRSWLSSVDGWPGYAASVNVDFTTAPVLVPEGLKSAILALVQAEYEADADTAEKLRSAALHLSYPWRRNLGV